MDTLALFGKLLFAHRADAAAVQAAIDAGNDINVPGGADAWTVLHYALVPVAYPPNVDVVRVLVANGADLGARDRRGWTPLHFAARTGCAETIALLLVAGADPNVPDEGGVTPLHRYVLGRRVAPEWVEFFLRHGARPTEALRSYLQACHSAETDPLRALLG